MLRLILMLLLFSGSASALAASAWDENIESMTQPMAMTVYHDPHCGCCTSWISHLEKHGFNVTSIKTDDMPAIKMKKQIPMQMESCHTAVIGNYVIEGHVPANDIKALLRSQDTTIYGLSVPAMPVGTPGMEMGTRKDAFNVISFDKAGKTNVYKTYKDY